jgi:hypothetical protein
MTFSYSQAQTGAVAEQSVPVGTSAVARWQWVQTQILHHPHLSTAEICVAVVLASHVNDRTQACFPKIETIASEAKLSDRKVPVPIRRTRIKKKTRMRRNRQILFLEPEQPSFLPSMINV